jgi:hypothetical protein
VDVFGVVAGPQQKYLRAAVVRAAGELRLWQALPASADEAADKLGLKSARRLRRLLDALALFGFARREGAGVFHALSHDPSAPVPDAGWGRLAEVIRTDRPVAEPGISGAGAPDELRRFHDHLFEIGAAPARELWAALLAEGPLLDLGGGSGAYSAAFPGEATLADTPAVLALSQAPRARRLALDLLNGVYPGDQGIVLLCNVLHLFGEHDCRTVLRKAAGALKPGGCLVVKDLLVDPDRSGPPEGVLFALNMALFTESGDVHDQPTVERWLREAGVPATRRIALPSAQASLVVVARA